MVGLHSGAVGIVFIVSLTVWLRLLLLLVVVASLRYTLALHANRRAARAVRTVEWEPDGEWTLGLHNADHCGPCRLRSRFVHPWLVVVHLRCPGAWFPMNLVIAADAVDDDAFRQLRVRLTMGDRDA